MHERWFQGSLLGKTVTIDFPAEEIADETSSTYFIRNFKKQKQDQKALI